MPIIASAGRTVAVFGAIIPSASASVGVIEGSGARGSALATRMSEPGSRAANPEMGGAVATDATARGFVESAGATSVESDIVVNAPGAAAGAADANAVA